MASSTKQKRAQPGAKGTSDYFRVIVRPKVEFTSFRYQDVGEQGHVQRLAGRRASGSWSTQAWLISKDDAHKLGEKLVPDTKDAKGIIEKLGTKPKHIKGDIFEAHDRPNVPERAKPTPAQKRARSANIKKARTTRHQ